MKIFAAVLAVAFFAVPALSSSSPVPASKKVLINVIEGRVFDEAHRPVPDLWVECLNEMGMGNRRVRTASSGRFTFAGLDNGRYEIKVYTSGTPFEEQSQYVEVTNVIQSGTGTFYTDFVLKYRKGMAGAVGIPQANEAIFVQEVPDAARKLYHEGVKDLGSADQVKRGQEELDEAIKIFPDYYDALNALGCNYVDSKEYSKSLPYLIHAIDVNQRSFSSFYSLGYAAFKLGHYPEASEAARAATILQPNSLNAQLLYGTVLRLLGNYDKSLEALLKAEKLSKETPVGEIHSQLAQLYMRTQKNKEAADELETYLKIEPNNPRKKDVQALIQKLRSKAATT